MESTGLCTEDPSKRNPQVIRGKAPETSPSKESFEIPTIDAPIGEERKRRKTLTDGLQARMLTEGKGERKKGRREGIPPADEKT